MRGDANGICDYVLSEVGFLDLPENAFIKGAVGLGLPRKFLITDGSFG
jgi:hypothetical protein